MNYVPNFNIFGVEAQQIPCTPCDDVPDGTTEGAVGCLRLHKSTGDIYKCTVAANGEYTWVNIGAALSTILDGLVEIEKCNNILDPANTESGYYDTSLTPMSSAKHIRTKTPIPVKGGSKLYLNTIYSTDRDDIVCVMQIDSAGKYIKQEVKTFATTFKQGNAESSMNSETAAVHIWISGYGYGNSIEKLCISTTPLDGFEAYSSGGKKTIREDALPPELFEDNRSLSGKTIVNFGDSIFGKRRPPDDISTELSKLTGATVHNCGFGGCRMASHTIANFDAFSMYQLADAIAAQNFTVQDAAIESGKTAATESEGKLPSYFEEALAILKGLDFSKVDIITIAYGTNDFTSNIDLDNSDNAYDTTKFAGALRHSIETLLTAYPHLKIFICSQTYRFWMDASNVFTEDSDTHVNGDNVKLTDFVEKTEEVANAYHLPYINNYNIGMNKYNRSRYFPATDGTHPLTTGCHLIAAHIAKELF